MRRHVVLAVALLLIASLVTSLLPSPVQAQSWLTGWNYRKKITIDQTKVDDDLTDFPVLVKLTSTNFDFSKALSTGYDIRFTSSDGETLLKYERERHDNANSLAEYWVKVPSVSGTNNTEFYIYYGKSDASDGADPTNVWDSNFKMIQHLKENPAGTAPQAQDSTTNNNDGTSYGTMTASDLVDGQVGKAWDFDGSDDYASIPADPSLNAITSEVTVCAWIRLSATNLDQKVFGTQDNIAGGFKLGLYTNNKVELEIRDSGNGYYQIRDVSGGTALTTGNWYFVCGVYKDAENWLATYVNGSLDREKSTTGVLASTSGVQAIGKEPFSNGYYFHGLIDELRVSNVARSAAWIKASYNSGNNSLVSYSSEETSVPAVTTNAATIIESTTATLNGNVTAINDTSITERGFDWDTDTGTPYTYSWTETGTFSTGTFSHGLTGLSAGTTYYFRAKAENNNPDWGYGSELTFLTKPAAPTNVTATDGTDTAKVVITWTKSTGATDYQVYRDGVALGWLGDVATYDDTGHGACISWCSHAVRCYQADYLKQKREALEFPDSVAQSLCCGVEPLDNKTGSLHNV